jgi:cell division protein FtsI (penicillin-binding protein 3)
MISDKIFASAMGSWSAGIDSIVKKGDKGVVGRQTTAMSYQQLMDALGMQANKEALDKRAIARVTTDTAKNVFLRQQNVVKGIVPDVSGMSLRDAVYLLETAGLQVQISGRGAVRGQSIAPGSAAVKGQLITIQLS